MSPARGELIEQRWARFIHDYERTKHEYRVVLAFAAIPLAHLHLAGLLPSFLYVQVATVLDEGFEEIVALDYPTWSERRPSFGKRLDLLTGKERLIDPAACKLVKDRRDILAHSLDTYVDWAALDTAVAVVERELQHLRLVGERPRFDFTTSLTPGR